MTEEDRAKLDFIVKWVNRQVEKDISEKYSRLRSANLLSYETSAELYGVEIERSLFKWNRSQKSLN